jgi:hypothetical protein
VLLLNHSLLTQALIVIAIIVGIFTGIDNVFTTPDFARGDTGKTWGHVFGHLVAGLILTLLGWIVASPILYVSRKMSSAA